MFLDQVGQHFGLAMTIHRMDLLRNDFHRRVAPRHLDHRGLVEQAIGQGLDLVGESGGEQQVLARPRQQGQDALDVMNEAHVEHAIGFVKHQDFDPGEIERTLLVQVEQAAGCGYHDVDALAQGVDLRIDADATIDHRGLDLQVLAIGAYRLLDLRGQFAGGRENQAAHRARAVR